MRGKAGRIGRLSVQADSNSAQSVQRVERAVWQVQEARFRWAVLEGRGASGFGSGGAGPLVEGEQFSHVGVDLGQCFSERRANDGPLAG